MLCKNPYMVGSIPAGCGQCMPCRINRRRLWTHRMMLESYKHADNSFLTLTYDDDHIPPGGSLDPSHTRNWLKRFRKAIAPNKVRFYLVGEYGDESQRPHYHAALFGVGPDHIVINETLYSVPHLVERTWGQGHVMLGSLTDSSAQYICGYVTKKMTSKDDPRLLGRHPEFARMSNRPGIGADAMNDIADLLFSEHGMDEVINTGDVPNSLRHGGRVLPLGRYLRDKLRDAVGMDDTTRERIKLDVQKEMSSVFVHAQDDPSLSPEEKLTVKRVLLRQNKGKVASVEARAKIYSKKGSI